MATLDSDRELKNADIMHHEKDHDGSETSGDVLAGGFTTDLEHLPKGYYTSKFFLGTFAAAGMAILCGVSAFAYAAPVLAAINADIGPDPSYVWISYVYSTATAVTFPVLGRMSDIFGRRYFFIGGAILAVIGAIICATASSIPVLIGGNVFLGVASATQLSYHYVLGELVPLRYRYLATGCLYTFTLPGSGFGPIIANSVLKYHNGNWRILYYIILGFNVVALALWVTFYFPPNYEQINHNRSKRYWAKNFDYVGLLLFASGFVLFLFGISAGGTVSPWKSGMVLSMIIIGAVLLVVFVLWECYAPIEQPLVPMRLFKNLSWSFYCVILGSAASVYYGSSIVWPTQVAVLYGDGDLIKTGWLSILPGLSNIAGQMVAGPLIRPLKHHKIQMILAALTAGIALGCAATITQTNRGTEMAMVIIGAFFNGWLEMLLLTNSTIVIADQHEIGVAGGASAGLRSAISAIAVVIYVTALTNRLTQNLSTQVPAALIAAGLPASSVEAFIEAIYLGTPTAFAGVPGISQKIIAAGITSYREANVDAYRLVWLLTIVFSGLALVLVIFTEDTSKYNSTKVAATLRPAVEQPDNKAEQMDEK